MKTPNQVRDRRAFLEGSLKTSAGIAIGTSLPSGWIQALAESSHQSGTKGDRILVVLQLSGGNDGLNTVIPYRNEDYQKGRPTIGFQANRVLKVHDELGLHPAMMGVEKLIDAGRFSILHGVGYAKPNRSHFESMDIWHTCSRKESRDGAGWIGRYIAGRNKKSSDAAGLHLGSEQQPAALTGRGVQVPSIASLDQFRLKIADDGILTRESMVEDRKAPPSNDKEEAGLLDFVESSTEAALEASERLSQALKHADDQTDFPKTPLGEKLRIISRLIVAGLTTQVYYVTLDGFDTHSQQAPAHESLLRQWSDALQAFVKRLEAAGEADRVLVMTFSEFGRRVAENASEGTDHGAAAPLFFAGTKLPKLEVGALPNLKDLDDGDLKFHTDFRQVYATILERWFGLPESKSILGDTYTPLHVWG